MKQALNGYLLAMNTPVKRSINARKACQFDGELLTNGCCVVRIPHWSICHGTKYAKKKNGMIFAVRVLFTFPSDVTIGNEFINIISSCIIFASN